MRRKIVSLLVLVVALSLLSAQSLYIQSKAASTPLAVVTSSPSVTPKTVTINVLNATIIEIGNSTITVESNQFSGELIAIGRWIMLSKNEVGIRCWLEAKNSIEEGEAVIVMATVSRGNKTIDVLMGLKQDDVVLVRPILMKHAVIKVRHGTFEFSCKLIDKMGPLLVIEKREIRALVLVNPESKWYKAGYGDVLWKDVIDEFNIGDALWLCTHNIAVLRDDFSKIFGFKAVIWGFSGAIIDLTSGVAVAKYPL
ncbi:MAG: hypothetical protein ACXQTI_09285 [Candidatus Nezhaarchaeales archaeon]